MKIKTALLAVLLLAGLNAGAQTIKPYPEDKILGKPVFTEVLDSSGKVLGRFLYRDGYIQVMDTMGLIDFMARYFKVLPSNTPKFTKHVHKPWIIEKGHHWVCECHQAFEYEPFKNH